jgi:hypothetical protein
MKSITSLTVNKIYKKRFALKSAFDALKKSKSALFKVETIISYNLMCIFIMLLQKLPFTTNK